MRRNILCFTALCQVAIPRFRPVVTDVRAGVYQVGVHHFAKVLGLSLEDVHFTAYLQLTPVPSAPSFVGG